MLIGTFGLQKPSRSGSSREPAGIRGDVLYRVRPQSVASLDQLVLAITERIAFECRPIGAALLSQIDRTRRERIVRRQIDCIRGSLSGRVRAIQSKSLRRVAGGRPHGMEPGIPVVVGEHREARGGRTPDGVKFALQSGGS